MADAKKRKAPSSGNNDANKKPKTKKLWQVPKKNPRSFPQSGSIEPGDAGIWATCERGKEAKAVGELKDLFQQYAEKLYGISLDDKKTANEDGENDIEAEIQQELNDLHKPKEKPLFANVRMDIQCVIFIKTRAPIEPVSFVHAILKDATTPGAYRTRLIKRLTPMTAIGKASEGGLVDIAKSTLAPHFHDGNGSKSFAIRPSLRNSGKILTRDNIIKKVAELVGPEHKVDLTNPDVVVLVEVYKNVCGISVVPGDYEELKRYNLSEIHGPENAKDGEKKEVTEGAVRSGPATIPQDEPQEVPT